MTAFSLDGSPSLQPAVQTYWCSCWNPTDCIVKTELFPWVLSFPPNGWSNWVLQEKYGDSQSVVRQLRASLCPICATTLWSGTMSSIPNSLAETREKEEHSGHMHVDAVLQINIYLLAVYNQAFIQLRQTQFSKTCF